MKPVKFVFKLVLWSVGIVLALVLALPLWVGPVVKTAANAIVPMKTGTPFMLGEFQLNPYGGKLQVGGIRLANPTGFVPPVAMTLGRLSVDVDTLSVLGETIVVRDITLTDLFASYVVNGNGETNIDIIKRHAKGEAGEDQEAEDVKSPEPKMREPKTAATGDEKSGGKKIIIDHLLVDNVVVQLGPVPMPMPKIELRDIGRKSNGVTLQEAWTQIYAQISANFGAFGINLNGLTDGLNADALNQALKAIDTSKVMDSEHVKGVLNATSQTLDATSKTTNQALNTATETTNKATDALNQGVEKANKAIDAIKGLF